MIKNRFQRKSLYFLLIASVVVVGSLWFVMRLSGLSYGAYTWQNYSASYEECSPKVEFKMLGNSSRNMNSPALHKATVTTEFEDQDKCPPGERTATFELEETASTPDTTLRGDKLRKLQETSKESGPSYLAFIFQPGHSWDWTNTADLSCMEAVSIGVIKGKIIGVSKGYKRIKALGELADGKGKVDGALDIYDDVGDGEHPKLLRIAYYDIAYRLSDSVSGRLAYKEKPKLLTVIVPDSNRASWTSWLWLKSYGTALGWLPGPGTALGVAAQSVGCLAYDHANFVYKRSAMSQNAVLEDYKAEVELVEISSATLDSQPESTGKTIGLQLLEVQAYQVARDASIERYEQAKAADDREWMVKHLQNAGAFNDEFARLLLEIRQLTEDLARELESDGFVLTEAYLQNWKADLAANGITESERKMLEELGFSKLEIEAYSNVAADYVDAVPLEWEEATGVFLDLGGWTVDAVNEWLEKEEQSLSEGIFLPIIIKP